VRCWYATASGTGETTGGTSEGEGSLGSGSAGSGGGGGLEAKSARKYCAAAGAGATLGSAVKSAGVDAIGGGATARAGATLGSAGNGSTLVTVAKMLESSGEVSSSGDCKVSMALALRTTQLVSD
jgi:hypothetical protein